MNQRFVKNSMQQYKPESQASVFPQAIRLTRLPVGLVFLSAQGEAPDELACSAPQERRPPRLSRVYFGTIALVRFGTDIFHLRGA